MAKKGKKGKAGVDPKPAVAPGVSFDEFADDLLAERGFRLLVIVGASKIDQLLLAVLEAHLLPKTVRASQPDELLEGDRPLGTFSSRIKLCYRLGLIDETLFKALEKLRAVRNPCAHHISFDPTRSPIREHLTDLRTHMTLRPSFRLTRNRYFDVPELTSVEELQCTLLTLCVLLEAIREKILVTTGHKAALRIAAG